MNKAKLSSQTDGKSFLKERFIDVESTFLDDLKREQRANTHDATLGDVTEDVWINLLNNYLPTRYKVAKAFAVDHLGHTTDQLDCLIYDAFFTPALFGKGKGLYVPAEAVYGTFEIKPTINAQYLKQAAEKVESLRGLIRTSAALESSYGKNNPKVAFPIIGGILAMKAEWKDGLGASFLSQFNKYSGNQQLDFVLTAESGFCDRLDSTKNLEILTGSGSLIRGLFRLLRVLRSKASVVAVEWEKYESVFEN